MIPFAEVQAAMDRVITTHGAYIPIELLLALDRLRYPDYEAWRCGRRTSLQAVLDDDFRDTVVLLQQAAEWAQALDLQPEAQIHVGWGVCAGRRLAIVEGRWDEAEALVATHYVRAATTAGDQLDLFLDSGTIAALQDLRIALRTRDPDVADRALTALLAREPAHPLGPPARRLIDALSDVSTALSPARAESELAMLEQTLVPAARDVLGAHVRDLVAPFWQRLAAALDGVAFDPERPGLHASHAWARCLDWRRTVAAVEAVRDYAEQPVLLQRLAQARHRSDDRSGALEAWFLLCWCFPEAAAEVLGHPDVPDAKLGKTWRAFRDLDLDPLPETALFPARFLLSEPGLVHVLPVDLATGSGTGERAFRAVRRLLERDHIENRRAVSDVSPWLLQAYLDLRVPE